MKEGLTMAPKIKVTEEIYIAIKMLLNKGATQAEIKRFYDVGSDVCTRIKKSKDYQNFLDLREEKNQQNIKRYHEKNGSNISEKAAPLNAKDFYLVNRILQAAEEQTELLKGISAKLAYIVEQLS